LRSVKESLDISGKFDEKMSCTPDAGEIGGICSGRGACQVSNVTGKSYCDCAYPFASVGDFATDPSVDCGIDFPVTKVLWGICALFNLAVVLVSSRTMNNKRRSNQLLLSNPEVKMTILSVLYGTLVGTVSVLEASATYPGQYSLGISVTTTVLFAIGTFVYWIIAHYFFYLVMNISVRQMSFYSNDTSVQLRFMKILIIVVPICLVVAFVGCFIIIGFLFVEGSDQVFASLHYLLLALPISGAVSMIVCAFSPLIDQLDLAMSNNGSLNPETRVSFERTRKMFREQRRNLYIQIGIQMTCGVLFGAVPMLTRKSAYYVPIAWSGAASSMLTVGLVWGSPQFLGPSNKSVSSSGGENRVIANGGSAVVIQGVSSTVKKL